MSKYNTTFPLVQKRVADCREYSPLYTLKAHPRPSLHTFSSVLRPRTHSQNVFEPNLKTPMSGNMSASSNNTANSVSDQLQVVVQHHSATARADSRAQEKTVSKIRQSEAVYIQNHATISAFPEDAQMTKTNQPFATPDRHSTAARIQTETHNNNTTTDSIQSEVPYNQPSFREPEAYLEIPARVSKQRPRLYCICRRPEGDAAMIECSNGDWCSIGWYHALCVDMTDLPGLGGELRSLSKKPLWNGSQPC